jgi:methylenetetrahydrofolate reductase (NADPH)
VQDCAGFCQLDKDNGKEMRVIDLINSNEKTAFSFEILPPLKGTGIEKLYETIDTLREFDPKYINITTHRSEYVYKDLGNGLFQRNRLRRRPGTVSVAAAIQNIFPVPQWHKNPSIPNVHPSAYFNRLSVHRNAVLLDVAGDRIPP